MNKTKKIYKKLLIIAISVYAVLTLVNQERTLNQYAKDSQKVAEQLQEEKEYKEQLAKQKDEVDSLDFIEQAAREKLDMYLPNERVYVDVGI